MKAHFIAIGGSVMHKLAIVLKNKGWEVSGSDDNIYGNSEHNLRAAGLLPKSEGWFEGNIHSDIDIVILGMHAKKDNPELQKAEKLGLNILSFPGFIYQQSKNKQRIVIAGSHGKTTITSIILHVLNHTKKEFDYVLGASVKEFEDQVRLTDAPLIIIEGDEYLASATDRTPKFLKYNHHIGLISGISWDHANVFPSEESYLKQFELFADQTPKSGSIVFNEEDSLTSVIGNKERVDINSISYGTLPYTIKDGYPAITYSGKEIPLKIFGEHNINNISGAIKILERLGISTETIAKALKTFEGAEKRLQIVYDNLSKTIISDFAHAPSKVVASTRAAKGFYPKRKLITCVELHTFSSLNKDFLAQYSGSLNDGDINFVYYNPGNVVNKGLTEFTDQELKEYFDDVNLHVFKDPEMLKEAIKKEFVKNTTLLLMSSGTFDSLKISELY